MVACTSPEVVMAITDHLSGDARLVSGRNVGLQNRELVRASDEHLAPHSRKQDGVSKTEKWEPMRCA